MIPKLLFAMLAVASMFYFLVLRRHSPLPKLFVGVLFGTGMLFAIWPEGANLLAGLIGIGRGADLLMYLAIQLLFFVCLLLYIRSREDSDRLAAVVRELALTRPVRTEDDH